MAKWKWKICLLDECEQFQSFYFRTLCQWWLCLRVSMFSWSSHTLKMNEFQSLQTTYQSWSSSKSKQTSSKTQNTLFRRDECQLPRAGTSEMRNIELVRTGCCSALYSSPQGYIKWHITCHIEVGFHIHSAPYGNICSSYGEIPRSKLFSCQTMS